MPSEEEVRRRCIIDPQSCPVPPPALLVPTLTPQEQALVDEMETALYGVDTREEDVLAPIARHLLHHFHLSLRPAETAEPE